MTAKPIPLPSSGGSYTVKGDNLNQTQKPTHEPSPGERRKAAEADGAPPAATTGKGEKT